MAASEALYTLAPASLTVTQSGRSSSGMSLSAARTNSSLSRPAVPVLLRLVRIDGRGLYKFSRIVNHSELASAPESRVESYYRLAPRGRREQQRREVLAEYLDRLGVRPLAHLRAQRRLHRREEQPVQSVERRLAKIGRRRASRALDKRGT